MHIHPNIYIQIFPCLSSLIFSNTSTCVILYLIFHSIGCVRYLWEWLLIFHTWVRSCGVGFYVSDLSHLIFMLQMTRLKISRVDVSNYCYITDTHKHTHMHIVLYLSLCLLITNYAYCLILLVNKGSRQT